MSETQSVERRLLLMLVAIAGIAIFGVLAILPYRLYTRDILQATTDAHRLAAVVHTAVSDLLSREGHSEAVVADLVDRLESIANLEIRLRRVQDGETDPAITSGKGYSTRRDTELDYVTAPIIDREGNRWLASMHFDLSPMKRRSIRLIIDLVLAVTLGSLGFSIAIFLLIRRTLVQPIQAVTREISRIAADPNNEIRMPDFSTTEMMGLAREVERACRARSPGP